MHRFWKHLDLKKLLIPEDIVLKKDCIPVTEGFKTFDNTKIFYREALPPAADAIPSAISILLLHGKMFSSKTWHDLGTIQMLAAMGYPTVAIDLPGYANTPNATIHDRANFLHEIIQHFHLSHPVIVSPSMSGIYSIPYMLKYWKHMGGYIPVAPVGIESLEELPACKDLSCKDQVHPTLQEFLHDPIPDLSYIQVPTMIVYGEKDRSRSSALLSLLPAGQSQEIPNGSHPAYLDNPPLWHQLLYNFLGKLSENYNLEMQDVE